MKKLYIILTIMIFAITSLAAFDSSWLTEFEFENNTGEEIYYLFCTPSESSVWGPDILGYTESFFPSDRMTFLAYYPESTQLFDIKAITITGEVYEYYEFEISDNSRKNRFKIDDSSWSESIDIDSFYNDLNTLTITNETGYDIISLFVSPDDAEAYGIDFLSGRNYIYADDTYTVYLLLTGDTREYDLYAVDIDYDTYGFALTLNPKYDENHVSIDMDDLTD